MDKQARSALLPRRAGEGRASRAHRAGAPDPRAPPFDPAGGRRAPRAPETEPKEYLEAVFRGTRAAYSAEEILQAAIALHQAAAIEVIESTRGTP